MKGRSQIGLGDLNGHTHAFLNVAILGSGQGAGSGFAFPSVLNAKGYPRGTITTDTGTLCFTNNLYTGDYVAKWSDDGKVKIIHQDGGTLTVTANTDCTVSGNNSATLTITSTGPNPRIVFHANTVMLARLSYVFVAGTTYATIDGLFIGRADHEPGVAPGIGVNDIWNPDFVALMLDLNPGVIRFMDWQATNNSTESTFAFRRPSNAIGVQNTPISPSYWVSGGITNSGSDAYACSAPSGWPGLVDGSTAMGKISGANTIITASAIAAGASNPSGGNYIRLTVPDTSGMITGQRVGFSSSGGAGSGDGIYTITVIDDTHIDFQGSVYTTTRTNLRVSTATLDVAGSGPKPWVGGLGRLSISDASFGKATYDALLDAYVGGMNFTDSATPVGAAGAIPIELQIDLCNTLGCDMWVCIPALYTNASVTAMANIVKTTLSPSLTCYYEYSNEVWNPGFVQFATAAIRGRELGFKDQWELSYYGLRVRQIMDLITAEYGAQTNFKRFMGNQEFASASNNRTYQWQGQELVAGTTFNGRSTYDTYTGTHSYNSSPNRPMDICDLNSVAMYLFGAQISDGADGQAYANTGTGMTAGGPVGNIVGLIGAADQYALGDAVNVELALQWVDWDLRQGLLNGVARNPDCTLRGHAAQMATWETAMAAISRPAGMSAIGVAMYETAMSATYPTTAELTTLGVSNPSTYGDFAGAVNTLLVAYKNSTYYHFLVQDMIDMLNEAHPGRTATPCWFALQGGQGATNDAGRWSLMKGNTYSEKFESYYAMKNYNNCLRRKRLTATS